MRIQKSKQKIHNVIGETTFHMFFNIVGYHPPKPATTAQAIHACESCGSWSGAEELLAEMLELGNSAIDLKGLIPTLKRNDSQQLFFFFWNPKFLFFFQERSEDGDIFFKIWPICFHLHVFSGMLQCIESNAAYYLSAQCDSSSFVARQSCLKGTLSFWRWWDRPRNAYWLAIHR